MTGFRMIDSPRGIKFNNSETEAVLQSLRESRQSIVSGAFLTKANVLPNSVQVVGKLDLCFGIHQFPETLLARATVSMTIRQAVMPQAASTQKSQDALRTITKNVNVSELVFQFKESKDVFFLVPRDSTLEKSDSKFHLYTFLTLRKQPGGTTLQHQVIPVTFVSNPVTDAIVEVMRKHINKHNEVKDKMANAFRHIPKMEVKFLDFDDPNSDEVATGKTADSPKTGDAATKDDNEKKIKKPRGSRKRELALKVPKDETPQLTVATTTESEESAKLKKKKKASIIPDGWKCELCGVTTTVMRRRGPSGLNCACNSCGQAWAQANRARSSPVVAKQEV